MPVEFTEEENDVVSRCTTPEKVQEFLDGLAYNYEETGSTLRSFRRVVRDRVAHCMEGALFAASVLREHGYQARLLYKTRYFALFPDGNRTKFMSNRDGSITWV